MNGGIRKVWVVASVRVSTQQRDSDSGVATDSQSTLFFNVLVGCMRKRAQPSATLSGQCPHSAWCGNTQHCNSASSSYSTSSDIKASEPRFRFPFRKRSEVI
eukprot:scaffold3731_cov149-Isochrysis_galbana.AAC.3